MFFSESDAAFKKDYYRFIHAAVNRDIECMRAIHKDNPELVNTTVDRLPPVLFKLIEASYFHAVSEDVFLEIKAMGANLEYEHKVTNHWGLKVNHSLNALAWLFLVGGDQRLLDSLVALGVDENHASVEFMVTMIHKKETSRHFNFPCPLSSNPEGKSPVELVKIFEQKRSIKEESGYSHKI